MNLNKLFFFSNRVLISDFFSFIFTSEVFLISIFSFNPSFLDGMISFDVSGNIIILLSVCICSLQGSIKLLNSSIYSEALFFPSIFRSLLLYDKFIEKLLLLLD